MQGAEQTLTPRMRMRVVIPMAFGLLVTGVVLRAFGEKTQPLDLHPYLPLPETRGLLGATLREQLVQGSWVLAFFGALAGIALFLVTESLIRRLWRAPHEAAALLVAAVFVVSPGQEAFFRVVGSESLVLALAIVLWGIVLSLGTRTLPALLGILLAATAPAIHPLSLALLPGAVLGLRAAGHIPGRGRPSGAMLGILVLGFGALFAGSGLEESGVRSVHDLVSPGIGPVPSATWPGLETRRLEVAAASFAALPINLWNLNPRSFLPTGFHGLAGDWPVLPGLFIWCLVLALGALIGGVSRALWMTALVALAAIGGPFLTTGWVPGDRAQLLVAAVPALIWLGLVLAGFRTPFLKSTQLGISFGVVLVGYFVQQDLVPNFKARNYMLQLPTYDVGQFGGKLPAPDLERDPARLVLFLHDVGILDPDGPACRRAAHIRLEARAPSLRHQVLVDLLELPNPQDVNAPREKRELLRNLEDISSRLARIEERKQRGPWYGVLRPVMQDAELLIPEIMEYHDQLPTHARVVALVRRYKHLVRDLVVRCAQLGFDEEAVPFLEALTQFEPARASWKSQLGRVLAFTGKRTEAIKMLEEALEEMDSRELEAAFASGYLGRAQADEGRHKEALALLQRAWSRLGSRLRVWGGPLSSDYLHYWLIAELALARYELATTLDQRLVPQALSDVKRILDPPLDFGMRRVPALVLRARLHVLQGENEQARIRLRELRKLKVASLQERADGPVGRVDHPRFRRLGLRTLKKLLDPEKDRIEIAEIESELQALDG